MSAPTVLILEITWICKIQGTSHACLTDSKTFSFPKPGYTTQKDYCSRHQCSSNLKVIDPANTIHVHEPQCWFNVWPIA